jgi:hypothetical protein
MRYIIRAIDEREHFLPEIIEQIPHLEIVHDLSRNAMDTFLRALMHANGDPAVHLEDDSKLTSDFLAKIEPAIAVRPDRVVQFFSLRKGDEKAGSRWMPGRSFLMGQCFYLPPGYARALGQYYVRWPRRREHPTGLDTMIADWLGDRQERYWLHVPSLVQHRDTPSAINPRRSSKRQSVTFRP